MTVKTVIGKLLFFLARLESRWHIQFIEIHLRIIIFKNYKKKSQSFQKEEKIIRAHYRIRRRNIGFSLRYISYSS